jgi:hypothetical protein
VIEHETTTTKAILDELFLLAVWVGSIFISPDALHDIPASLQERLFYYIMPDYPMQDYDDKYIVFIMTILMTSIKKNCHSSPAFTVV